MEVQVKGSEWGRRRRPHAQAIQPLPDHGPRREEGIVFQKQQCILDCSKEYFSVRAWYAFSTFRQPSSSSLFSVQENTVEAVAVLRLDCLPHFARAPPSAYFREERSGVNLNELYFVECCATGALSWLLGVDPKVSHPLHCRFWYFILLPEHECRSL